MNQKVKRVGEKRSEFIAVCKKSEIRSLRVILAVWIQKSTSFSSTQDIGTQF